MCGLLNALSNPKCSHGQNWHEKPDAQGAPKVGPVDNVGCDVLASGAVCGDVGGEVGCVDLPSALLKS